MPKANHGGVSNGTGPPAPEPAPAKAKAKAEPKAEAKRPAGSVQVGAKGK